jgi:hypothetical protein
MNINILEILSTRFSFRKIAIKPALNVAPKPALVICPKAIVVPKVVRKIEFLLALVYANSLHSTNFAVLDSAVAQTNSLLQLVTFGPTDSTYRSMCATQIKAIQDLHMRMYYEADFSEFPEFCEYLSKSAQTVSELMAVPNSVIRINSTCVVNLTDVKHFYVLGNYANLDFSTANKLETLGIFDRTMDGSLCTALQNLAKKKTLKSLITKLWGTSSLPDSAFKGATALVDLWGFENVTSLGTHCFDGCTALKTLGATLNEVNLDITTMGSYAFYNCSNLLKVDIPNLTSVLAYSFYNCARLANVSCPNVTTLGTDAFYACENLSSLALGTVTVVPEAAFAKCPLLPDSLALFATVTEIGENAFEACDFTSIIAPKLILARNGSFHNCRNLIGFIAEKMTTAGNSAFSYTGFKFMTVAPTAVIKCDSEDEHHSLSDDKVFCSPELATLGEQCFYHCAALKVVVLPKATSFGASCFAQCNEIKSLYLPSATNFGMNIFAGVEPERLFVSVSFSTKLPVLSKLVEIGLSLEPTDTDSSAVTKVSAFCTNVLQTKPSSLSRFSIDVGNHINAGLTVPQTATSESDFTAPIALRLGSWLSWFERLQGGPSFLTHAIWTGCNTHSLEIGWPLWGYNDLPLDVKWKIIRNRQRDLVSNRALSFPNSYSLHFNTISAALLYNDQEGVNYAYDSFYSELAYFGMYDYEVILIPL